MTNELSGECACGEVSYKIFGEIKAVVNCHCDSCRKYNGTAYTTYCVVKQSDLIVHMGLDKISTYDFGSGHKHVCSKCGSPLYNAHEMKYPGMYMLYYGSISQNYKKAPNFNIYCENKLPWVDDLSQIKSFQQGVQR